MFKHSLRALLALSAMASAQSSMAAYAAPPINLGTVTTWSVAQQDFSRYDTTNTQALSFSLASASDVRIDMRTVEHAWKYDASTFKIINANFKVFDATHTLVGNSSLDSAFTGSLCTDTPSSGGIQLCSTNYGLTLGSTLAAGSYTIEFSMDKLGTYAPSATFGVALNSPANLGAYLPAVTPALAVPEASTFAMMGLGLAGLAALARKQRKGRVTAA